MYWEKVATFTEVHFSDNSAGGQNPDGVDVFTVWKQPEAENSSNYIYKIGFETKGDGL